MKKGDKLAVSIGGHEVAQAEITYIGEGRAEMTIPATKVVMGVRTELDAAPTPPPATTETVITGVDREGQVAVDLPGESAQAETVAAPQPTPAVSLAAPAQNNTAAPVPETIIEAAGGQAEVPTQ